MDHEDHAGHGAQGGDHRPGTGQLSPERAPPARRAGHPAGRPAATRGTAPTGAVVAGTRTMPPSSGTGSG